VYTRAVTAPDWARSVIAVPLLAGTPDRARTPAASRALVAAVETKAA
jgi:hypothetical protein